MRGQVGYEDLDPEDMVIVGDVDKCIQKIEHYQRVGVDRVGKHVIPHFDRDRRR